jgi:restriction system protein
MALHPTNIDDYLSVCPEIAESARYWFFRTDGGSLFEPFITSQCIAIGYPSISMGTLTALQNDQKSKKALAVQIKRADVSEERPGLAARQLLIFARVMKEGDFIIIPSTSSHQLAIGVITGTNPFESRLLYNGKEFENFKKQRKVHWLTRVQRESVNPNLYRMLFAHQTITDVTSWGQWIDTLLFDFFKKGPKYHYVLGINQSGGINARDLFHLWIDLFDLAESFASTIGVTEDTSKVDTRINLNSPGDVELITHAAKFIFVIGAIVVALVGGGLKVTIKKDFMANLSTDGFMKLLNRFLNDQKNRQLSDTLRKKLDALQIKKPEEIVKMIGKIDKKKP